MPSTNQINQISPSIRDELLKRNLILSDAIEDNSLGGYASGLGRPASIGDQSSSVQQQNVQGKTFREKIMGLNPYGADQEQVTDIQDKNLEQVGNNASNSQEPYNGPNIEEGDNVQTLGEEERKRNTSINPYKPDNGYNKVIISTNNIENIGNMDQNDRGDPYDGPDIDIRNSILLRQLTPNVQENDTLIGQLGDDYRNLSFIERFEQNAETQTIGRINTSPIRLLTGNDFVRPNFSITVPKGQLGKAADFTSRVLGFEVPVSTMSEGASIFYSENPVNNITRANEMLDNTGEGQVVTLINTINENKYKPQFSDDRTQQGLVRAEKGTNPEIYAFGNGNGGIIDVLNEEQSSPISYSNKNDFTEKFSSGDTLTNEQGFAWSNQEAEPPQSSDEAIAQFATRNFVNPKSILFKTENLFRTGEMGTFISQKGQTAEDDEVQRNGTVGGYIPRGSGVPSTRAIESDDINSPDDAFCRSWTNIHKYEFGMDLQKSDSLYSDVGSMERGENIDHSVLDSAGHVRITPRRDEPADVKKYMLSIENLAWSEYTANLPEYEIGPGDPVTGTKGRIMWFPPYDISVDDNVTVNWNSTEFIGRGEPIYTYNNTERVVTLGFKVIIDYPSYLDEAKHASSEDQLHSAIAGCYDISDLPKRILSVQEYQAAQNQSSEKDKMNDQEKEDDKQPDTSKFEFKLYFPNSFSKVEQIPDYYENGDVDDNQQIKDGGKFSGKDAETRKYETDDGLNERYFEISNNKKGELSDFLSEDGECKECKVIIKGFASSHGNSFRDGEGRTLNEELASERAQNVKNWFVQNIGIDEDDVKIEVQQGEVVDVGEDDLTDLDGSQIYSRQAKEARKVKVTYEYRPEENDSNEADPKKPSEEDQETDKEGNSDSRIPNNILSRLIAERQYFEKLKEENKFIYNTLNEKIKYFHPSFHSTTPEGFNARLNFLHQCTRQGRTDSLGGGTRPNNLAFGRQPYCILRVGDFFNAKVIIDNLNISFEPLQWDLNPEGAGVQPMIAQVHLSMKMIGGSSLRGPINVLQNAISYNFFANTEIYEPKAIRAKGERGSADYEREQDIEKGQKGEENNANPSEEQKGKDTNKEGENETKQEERANQDNSGTENASDEGDINTMIKEDSSVKYNYDDLTFTVRLGKSGKQYEIDSNYDVEVYSKPVTNTSEFMTTEYKKVFPQTISVNEGTQERIVTKTSAIDLPDRHGFNEDSDVENFEFDIKLKWGSEKVIKTIKFKK